MSDLDDFHAFLSASGGSGSSSGAGCSGGCIPWILAGMVILRIIGKPAG